MVSFHVAGVDHLGQDLDLQFERGGAGSPGDGGHRARPVHPQGDPALTRPLRLEGQYSGMAHGQGNLVGHRAARGDVQGVAQGLGPGGRRKQHQPGRDRPPPSEDSFDPSSHRPHTSAPPRAGDACLRRAEYNARFAEGKARDGPGSNRHIFVVFGRLARGLLSPRHPSRRFSGLLRHAIRHGGVRRHFLPDSRPPHRGRLAGAHSGGVSSSAPSCPGRSPTGAAWSPAPISSASFWA